MDQYNTAAAQVGAMLKEAPRRASEGLSIGVSYSDEVTREVTAIDGALDEQDISLNILDDLISTLYDKLQPVTSRELSPGSESDRRGLEVYGSSPVFTRIATQRNRVLDQVDRLRYLRNIVEV